MSGTGRCYDNARMENFFATLKKEKLYKIQTEQMPMAQVKSIVFRYIITYYNRIRVSIPAIRAGFRLLCIVRPQEAWLPNQYFWGVHTLHSS